MPPVKSGITQTFYGRVQKYAKHRNIDVLLSLDDLKEVFNDQGERCVYTGLPLINSGRGNWNFSLDRIDATKPYQVDNVQFVYKPINSMKWVLSDREFLFGVKSIVECPDIAIPIDLHPLSDMKRTARFKGIGPITKEWFGARERNARKRDIEWNLDIADVYHLYKQQGGLCAYTKWPIKFADSSNGCKGNASIDRIDSDLPYTVDNIVLCHKNINFMKGPLSESEFFQIITEIYNWSILLGQPNRRIL